VRQIRAQAHAPVKRLLPLPEMLPRPGEYESVLVAGLVVADVFLLFVPGSVSVEVAVGAQAAPFQDGFGAGRPSAIR
jgi:hypothetical protein